MSAIGTSRSQLFDILVEAFEAEPDVQVVYGIPDNDDERQEVVCLAGVSDGSDSVLSLGASTRNEVFGLDMIVKVYDPAGTRQEVDVRAWQMVDAIEAGVTAAACLNGTAYRTEFGTKLSDGPIAAEGGGSVVFVQLTLDVSARI